jgi:hypothetical protein
VVGRCDKVGTDYALTLLTAKHLACAAPVWLPVRTHSFLIRRVQVQVQVQVKTARRDEQPGTLTAIA